MEARPVLPQEAQGTFQGGRDAKALGPHVLHACTLLAEVSAPVPVQ